MTNIYLDPDVGKIYTIFIIQCGLNYLHCDFDIGIINVYQHALEVAMAIRSLSDHVQTITK